jgi:hypothetical protein
MGTSLEMGMGFDLWDQDVGRPSGPCPEQA